MKSKVIKVFPREIKRKRDYRHCRGMMSAGAEHRDMTPEQVLQWLRKHKIIQ